MILHARILEVSHKAFLNQVNCSSFRFLRSNIDLNSLSFIQIEIECGGCDVCSMRPFWFSSEEIVVFYSNLLLDLTNI